MRTGPATMAFGYPEFEPAVPAESVFRTTSWYVEADGFDRIDDAAVIRRGSPDAPGAAPVAAAPAPTPSAPTHSAPTPPMPGPTGDRYSREWPVAPRAGGGSWGASQADLNTQPVDLTSLFAVDPTWSTDHPSGPLPQSGTWPPVEAGPAYPTDWLIPPRRDRGLFDATLGGALGVVELGLRAGQWYSLFPESERRVTVAEAIRSHPELAGQITQLVCWWMRQHPMSDRAVDLAHELAGAVAESVARVSGTC